MSASALIDLRVLSVYERIHLCDQIRTSCRQGTVEHVFRDHRTGIGDKADGSGDSV